MKNVLRFCAVLSALLFAVPAFAHIQIDEPAQRISDQKTGPCGSGSSTRGNNITTLTGGSTYTVRWRETINHPSHYRISIDMDGQDDFADPATMNEYYTNAAVLVDEIADSNGGMYEQEITVPNVDCNNCTLQLIQVMYDKPPYGDGNDMYYQCADIIIEADPNAPDMGGGDDMGMGNPDMGAGCTVDTDCMTGETCNNGMCEAGNTSDCALDSHCGAGQICEFGACVVGTRPDGNNTAGNNSNTNGNNTNGGDPNGQDSGGDDDESCASAGSSAPAPIGLLLIALVALRVRRQREARG